MDNLIDPSKQYLHPLTRLASKVHRMTVNAFGNLIEENSTECNRNRSIITAEQLVKYYYAKVNIKDHTHLHRDIGSVKYLVRTMGLDVTLFCIDSLIDDYITQENRPLYPPDIINASNYTKIAEQRMGIVKMVVQQYA